MKLSRPRTRTVLILGSVLLVLMILFVPRNSRQEELSVAEQQLVGIWRQVADDFNSANLFVLDSELRDDHTLHFTSTDKQTNFTSRTANAGKWRIENDMIVLSETPQRKGSTRLSIVNLLSYFNRPHKVGYQIDASDNTTMQLKMVNLNSGGKIAPQPLGTCTWVRVTPAATPPPPPP